MGNIDCKHEDTEIVETVNEKQDLFFNRKIVIVRCKHCLTNGEPTLIRKEVVEGLLTEIIYSNKVVDSNKCKHKNFTVDSSTEEYYQETTTEGIFLGMLTAHWFEPKNYYIKGIACCDRCGYKFPVKCSYTTETKWINYERKSFENRDKWLPIDN